jgi:hypothetical protein
MSRLLQDYFPKSNDLSSTPAGVKLFALNTLVMLIIGAAGGHKAEWNYSQINR